MSVEKPEIVTIRDNRTGEIHQGYLYKIVGGHVVVGDGVTQTNQASVVEIPVSQVTILSESARKAA